MFSGNLDICKIKVVLALSHTHGRSVCHYNKSLAIYGNMPKTIIGFKSVCELILLLEK